MLADGQDIPDVADAGQGDFDGGVGGVLGVGDHAAVLAADADEDEVAVGGGEGEDLLAGEAFELGEGVGGLLGLFFVFFVGVFVVGIFIGLRRFVLGSLLRVGVAFMFVGVCFGVGVEGAGDFEEQAFGAGGDVGVALVFDDVVDDGGVVGQLGEQGGGGGEFEVAQVGDGGAFKRARLEVGLGGVDEALRLHGVDRKRQQRGE